MFENHKKERYTLDDYPVTYIKIGDGFAAIENTVKKMIEVINESAKNIRIRSKASDIIKDVPERDKYAECDAIYNWVRNHTHYVKDIDGEEMLQSPLVGLDMIGKGFAFQGDCFSGDTEIIVRNKITNLYSLKSFLDLKDTWKEYEALSYNFQKKEFEFKNIINFIHKKDIQTYAVKVISKKSFECTGTHEFFMYEGDQGKRKIVKRELLDIDLTKTKKRQILTVKDIPILSQNTLNPDVAFLKGIYTAEGFYDKNEPSKVCIAQNKKDIVFKIRQALTNLNIPFSERRTDGKSGGYFYIKNCAFKEELKRLGGNSFNVGMTDEILSSGRETILNVLNGYKLGDAYTPKENSKEFIKWNAIYNTSSDKLAKHLEFLHLLLGNPLTSYYQKNHMGVGRNPIWRLYDMKRRSNRGKTLEPHLCSNGVESVEKSKIQDVYCVTVQDNHNLVLSNGVLASNCDCLSTLLLSLLKSIGYSVGIRIVGYGKDKKYTHVYGLVYLGDWIPVDAIQRDVPIGWEHDNITCQKDYEV